MSTPSPQPMPTLKDLSQISEMNTDAAGGVKDGSTVIVYSLPCELRAACRAGLFTKQTSGQCPGYAQANLCILPREYAFDFLLFATRNPKPCPLLAVLEAGHYAISGKHGSDEDVDIRKDIPKYRVYRDGDIVEEVGDVSHLWREDLVTFVIGCSFSFEEALQNVGIGIRHIEQGSNVRINSSSCKHLNFLLEAHL